ncbi:MAG: hypothetical protein HC896_05460 [Bacteroidales bacterium]|nr:hypothetical protein [Bacteroidales bacterium]
MKEAISVETIQDFDKIVKWSYKLAKNWVKQHLVAKGINSVRKFERYKRDGGYLPKYFPREPDEVFGRDKKWNGWVDFFSKENNPIQHQGGTLNYEEAKNVIRHYPEIKNSGDYRRWEKRPKGLPVQPYTTYKKVWQGWPDFLGKNYTPPRSYRWSKLNEQKVRIIKHQLKMGVPGAVLAREFKVSEMQITRIRRGENWGNVEV